MASTIPVSERDPDRQVCIWFAEVIHLTGSVHPISFLYGKVWLMAYDNGGLFQLSN